jgi:hypothetical protein
MPTYTTSLQITEIDNGTQSGTWGTTTNANWQLADDAIAGVATVSVSGTSGWTLSTSNGGTDEARKAVIIVTGATSGTNAIVAPLVTKVYVISNQTTGGFAITIGATTGAKVTIPNGVTTLVYCDGTNFYSGITGFAGGNLTITGNITASGTITGSVFSGGAVTANLSGGANNKIHVQTGSSVTGFIDAPPSTGVPTFLSYNPATPGFTWSAASGTASNIIGGGTNTLVYQSTTNNTQFLANPGTGSTFYLTYNGGLVWATGGSVTAVAASSPLSAATVGGTATVSLTGTVAIANGGTGGTNTPTGGGIAYGTGSAYAFTTAGTTGQLLQSNGASAPSWLPQSSITVGSATTATQVAVTNTSASGTYYPALSPNNSGNNGVVTSSSNFTFNPGTGALSATSFTGAGTGLTGTASGFTAGTATNATNIAITDNTSSSSTYYPVLSVGTSSNQAATTSSTKISFVPSTGTLNTTIVNATTLSAGSPLTSYTLNVLGTQSGQVAAAITTNSTGSGLLINTTTGNTYAAIFQYAGTNCGSISVSSGATAYNTSSDRRLKTDIVPLTNAGFIIDSIQPKAFTWIETNKPGIGFIADELQQIVPGAVTGEPNAVDSEGNPIYQGIDASTPEMIALMVAELQSLRKRVAVLEAKVGV